ncbi:MAG: hypothetical protein LC746_07795 [Acidobacteria bacterium]|nr:hypothetical protein [Acidobacteriota bacterium]
MSKSFRILTRTVFSLALVALVAVSHHARAQSAVTGTWTATLDTSKPDRIQLNFERRTERGGRSQTGMGYEFSELQGLTREQARDGGAVRFSLVREAGRVDCEGTFQNGRGSGTFSFTSNPGFVAAMKSRGFDFEKQDSTRHGDERDVEDRLFSATALNVTTAAADDLASAGFGQLTVDDLFKAVIFKVDSKFMREMRASGFENMGMEELVKARIFKIDADYVRQVAQMGFAREPFESLVKMRIFKITPEFINEMRSEGLTNLSVEDLVRLQIFKVDAAFIRQARADGMPLDVESLVRRRIGARAR